MLEVNEWVDHASGCDAAQTGALQEVRENPDDSLQLPVVMLAKCANLTVALSLRENN